LRRLGVVLGTELNAKNKIQAVGSWQYQYLDPVLAFLTGAKNNSKN
jgi:hypothetical protein